MIIKIQFYIEMLMFYVKGEKMLDCVYIEIQCNKKYVNNIVDLYFNNQEYFILEVFKNLIKNY